MARLGKSSLSSLQGNLGDMIFYQINGVTYVRRKPQKRTNAQKKKLKKSPRNERSQGMFTLTQKYLLGLNKVIKFGFQNEVIGARSARNACVSYTRLNCFSFEDGKYAINPALFKFCLGSLMGPENGEATRTAEGVLFSWNDNSYFSSAMPSDQAFLVIHNPQKHAVVWEELGSYRHLKQHLLKHQFSDPQEEWHAYLAFSQANIRTKKRIFSDSVYLGLV